MKFRAETMMTRTGIAGLVLASSLSCSPAAPKAYQAPVFEKVTDSKVVVDPRVDILFVVDNSGSMDSHQQDLADNVAKFTTEFTNTSFIDYNIGVITTDNDSTYSSRAVCCGRLAGTPRFVTKNTPNVNNVLANTFKVGTDGSTTEKVFDPVQSALTDPNLSNWNAGFYRPTATLALVFITDAEDQSNNMDEDSFYNFLVNLKGGDTSKILGYGAIVPTGVSGCARDSSETPLHIESFLKKLVNNRDNVMSLCDPNFGSRLAALAKDIVKNVSTIRLSRVPYVPSIRVKWGNLEIPSDANNGWAFDASQNAIVFGPGIDWTAQPSGTPLTVDFDVATY
jgi:hypothetical protein